MKRLVVMVTYDAAGVPRPTWVRWLIVGLVVVGLVAAVLIRAVAG